jgi:DNA polymerase-3 subunit beta
MELVVRKFDLLKELQLFQGIVERKNTIPILANVLFEAKGDTVRLAATDLEVGLRAECKASISRSGALTLPAKKLFEIVKELPDTDIRIEEEKSGTVKVAADRFEGRMQTMPKDDFPTLPDLAAGEGVTVNRRLLREMVVKTQLATGSPLGPRRATATRRSRKRGRSSRRRRCRSSAGSLRRATRRSGSRAVTATFSSASTGGCSCRA